MCILKNEIAEIADSMGGYNTEDEYTGEEDIEKTAKPTKDKLAKEKLAKEKEKHAVLKSHLKTIVSASKDVLYKYNNSYYGRCVNPEQLCDFTGKRLSLKEVAFYKSIDSVKKVLRGLKAKIDAAPAYELFMEDFLSDQQKAGKFDYICLLYIMAFLTNSMV